MTAHRGTPWEAELAVVALEDGQKKLSDTHPRLLSELNLSPEHLERLLKVAQDSEDARRLHAHPNASPEFRRRLEQRFGL